MWLCRTWCKGQFHKKQKYSEDLKSVLVWILNGRKVVGLQKIRISNGIRNQEANYLKYGQMAAILSKTI